MFGSAKQFLLDEDRGVSPVIGVILMVAITVILAAVIATFVMNMGPQSATPANAQWDFSWDSGADKLTIEHTGGEAATAGDYKLVSSSTTVQLSASSMFGSSEITASDSATTGSFSTNTKVELIWMNPNNDETQIVDSYTTGS